MLTAAALQLLVNGEWACGVVLDVTLYLGSPPDRGQVEAAVAAYLAACPPSRTSHTMLGDVGLWDEHAPPPDPSVFRQLTATFGGPGHKVLKIWDGSEDEDSWSFTMHALRRVDDRPAASFCEVMMPAQTSADAVLSLTSALCDALPGLLSGHAGYATAFNPWLKEEAFKVIYGWARRYMGIDVADLNRSLPAVLHGLKGVGWITILGSRWWQVLKQAHDGPAPVFDPSVRIFRRPSAHLLVAGDRPSLLDRNGPESAAAYASVDAWIAPARVTRHGEFAGRFEDDADTMNWLRRFEPGSIW